MSKKYNKLFYNDNYDNNYYYNYLVNIDTRWMCPTTRDFLFSFLERCREGQSGPRNVFSQTGLSMGPC